MIPQIIYFALVLISLLFAANQHGKPKKGKHNFWVTVIACIISISILWWGGFFDKLFL